MRKRLLWIVLFLIPTTVCAISWQDLWYTRDQLGNKLLASNKAKEAEHCFSDKRWKAVAAYRAGNYVKAYKSFNTENTSDGQYNAGNAAAYLGKYQAALNAYDKAIKLNPNNTDAIYNREIIKKLLAQQKQNKNCACNNKSKTPRQNDKTNSQNNSAHSKQQQASQNQQQQTAQKQQANDLSQNNSARKHLNDTQSGQQADKQDKQEKTNMQKENFSGASHQALKLQASQDGDRAKEKNAQISQQEQARNQIYRRLPDDPRGLLQRKFLRDYMRRHAEENMLQGEF